MLQLAHGVSSVFFLAFAAELPLALELQRIALLEQELVVGAAGASARRADIDAGRLAPGMPEQTLWLSRCPRGSPPDKRSPPRCRNWCGVMWMPRRRSIALMIWIVRVLWSFLLPFLVTNRSPFGSALRRGKICRRYQRSRRATSSGTSATKSPAADFVSGCGNVQQQASPWPVGLAESAAANLTSSDFAA